jgi:hypothetical protein
MMLSVDFLHESVFFTVVPKVKIYEGMRHHMEKNKESNYQEIQSILLEKCEGNNFI